MSSLQRAIFCLFVVLFAIGGCKLDPPIYPAAGTSTGTTTGTDATYTVPVGAASTITFQVDGGEIVTLTGAASITQDKSTANPTGSSGLSANQTSPAIDIMLSFRSVGSVGEFDNDRFSLNYKTLVLTATGNGKFKVTTSTADSGGFYTIKGYFKITATDANGGTHVIVGSYNV